MSVDVVHGTMPDVLHDLREADSVFLGGGGLSVLETALKVGRPLRVVATLASLERVGPDARSSWHTKGFPRPAASCRLPGCRCCPTARHRLAAENPVFVLWGDRVVIGLVAATKAGRRQAERLAELWPDAKVFSGPVSTALPDAWAECTGIVAFLSVGATVRLLAGRSSVTSTPIPVWSASTRRVAGRCRCSVLTAAGPTTWPIGCLRRSAPPRS